MLVHADDDIEYFHQLLPYLQFSQLLKFLNWIGNRRIFCHFYW